jgi:hypothetical protein
MARGEEITQPTGAFQLFPVAGVRAHNAHTGPTFQRIAGLKGRHFEAPLSETLVRRIVRDGKEMLSEGETAVILIDMQGVATPKDWNDLVKQQRAVLGWANKLGLPIFEARRAQNFTDSQTLPSLRAEVTKSSNGFEFVRLVGNALEGLDERGGLRLRELLMAYEIGTAIVIGQESNQCVAATIFGQTLPAFTAVGAGGERYAPGLLDAGISVVTSRQVLYPKGLEPAFTFTDIGAGAALRNETGIAGRKSAPPELAAATEAHTSAALDIPCRRGSG